MPELAGQEIARPPAGPSGGRRRWRLSLDGWSAAALIIAAVVLAPIVSVLLLAAGGGADGLLALPAPALMRYVRNTLALMLGVGALAAAVGTGAAWLVTMYDFPLRRHLAWALMLPLAVPAYVGAYALVDFLEYAGPVQTGLRALFGWHSARDYWFPEIRSLGGAAIVLAASLYPYVYLMVRTALAEQSAAAFDVARTLGAGPVARFLRLGAPLSRPAIAAATAVVMMETVNDFGTVDYFSVQTLTTGIFTTWLEARNAAGAAQLAVAMLAVVFALSIGERISRRRSRFFRVARSSAAPRRQRLTGPAAALATAACLVPVGVGFLLPAGVILAHALAAPAGWEDPALLRALGNTLATGGAAALITLIAGLVVVYGVRLSGRLLPRLLLPLTTLGYAVPGAVLGLGLLVPLAALDNRLADAIAALTGHDPGLLLTGTPAAIVLAWSVRFFAVAEGAIDAGMGRITPSLPAAARTLGHGALSTLLRLHLPLMRRSLATGLLLVFVDAVKELPATLLLRPFNFDTLATRVHEQASLENLADAAPAAVMIMLVGLGAVVLILRRTR